MNKLKLIPAYKLNLFRIDKPIKKLLRELPKKNAEKIAETILSWPKTVLNNIDNIYHDFKVRHYNVVHFQA